MNKRMKSRSPVARYAVSISLLLLLLLTAPCARADYVGYNKLVTLHAETGEVRAEHRHDWSDATRAARFKMVTASNNPFTRANDYAHLRLHDKNSGRELFRRPVPAFSHLWISADSQYVVGISNIMLWNPYHIVVFNRSGDRLFEKDMTRLSWPGSSRSVTNWVFWYKEPIPSIDIADNGKYLTLSIEDRRGVRREFYFLAARADAAPGPTAGL